MAPASIPWTADEAANVLLAADANALLIGFVLDQQVPVQKAFAGPKVLLERLGHLDPARIAAMDPDAFIAVCVERPAIHRFPGSMAERLQTLAAIVVERYDGHAERIWTEASSGADLLKRVMELPGFGRQKAQIFTALVAKQLDVRPDGWQQAVGDYALEGYRSVADVVDPASLQKVRDFKQEKKRAAKAAQAAG